LQTPDSISTVRWLASPERTAALLAVDEHLGGTERMSGMSSISGSIPSQIPPSIDDVEAGAAVPAEPEAAPAPPPAAPPAADAPGRRSGAYRLLDRGLSEAEKAISKEILKPHEVDESFKVVEGLSAGVRVKESIWLPTAKEIAGDPLKKATSDALAADGKTIAWAKVEGDVKLASSFTTTAGDTTIGFPGGAKLGYTLTKPYAYKEDGRATAWDTAKDAFKSQTWGLPTNSKNARNLPAGSEFQLKGELSLGATAAGGGAALSVKSGGWAQVDVKRGAGDTAVVTVTKERSTDTAASLGRPIAGGLSGSLGRTTVDGEKTVETFTLDLSNPRAQATYDALVKGDTSAARAVAAGGAASGVTVGARTDEEWDGRKLAGGLALKLSSGFGAGLSVYGEKVSERDGRITGSPMRQRMITEAKAKGESIEFHGTGGALEASFGVDATYGVAGAGFSTKGLIEYHAVAPGGKVSPKELPLDASKARDLAVGTEVTLHGAGTIAAKTNVGYGVSTSAAGITAGATIGVSGELRASTDVGLNIVRLPGDKVRVVIADRDTKTATTTVAAEAGIRSVNRDEIPGGAALEGIVGDKLGGEAKKAVAKELTKYVQAKASMGASAETSAREVASYDLDLSTEAGKKAYDRLLRLDAREAEKLAATPGSGVVKNGSLDETIESKRTQAEVSILGQTLATSKSERRDRVAVLVNAAGTTRILESEYTKSKKGLLRSGDIEWEAVQVKNDKTGQSERFLHLTMGKLEDKWTSHDEWERSERFAGMMGATVVEREVKDENPSWWNRNISPSAHGKTTASADVYFTDAAMKKVAAADDEKAISAFGLSTMKLSGDQEMPGWAAGPAAMKKAARELLEAYDPFEHQRDTQDLQAQYYRLTKRNLNEDHTSWEEAKDFQKFVARSRTGDEAERLKAFADLGKERRFDFHATIGAMNELAGEEVVLLNRFEVRGSDAKLVTASEGALKHPDTGVSEAFTPQ